MLKRRSEESGNGSGPFVLGRIEAQGGIAVQRFTTALRETFAGQLTIAPFDRRPCSENSSSVFAMQRTLSQRKQNRDIALPRTRLGAADCLG